MGVGESITEWMGGVGGLGQSANTRQTETTRLSASRNGWVWVVLAKASLGCFLHEGKRHGMDGLKNGKTTVMGFDGTTQTTAPRSWLSETTPHPPTVFLCFTPTPIRLASTPHLSLQTHTPYLTVYRHHSAHFPTSPPGFCNHDVCTAKCCRVTW